MSTIQSERKMKPMEEMCYDMGYAKGKEDAVVHGRWLHTHTSESYMTECLRCSWCGFDDTEMYDTPYCPHCGVKMDLEDDAK